MTHNTTDVDRGRIADGAKDVHRFGDHSASPRHAFRKAAVQEELREELVQGRTIRLFYKSRRADDVKDAEATVLRPGGDGGLMVWATEGDGTTLMASFGWGSMAELHRKNPSRNSRLGYLVAIEIVEDADVDA